MARNCLTYLASKEPAVASSYIIQLTRAEAPLLRQIAIAGVVNETNLAANQKIQWVLENFDFYDRACRREIASLLEQTYCDASDGQRKLVLAAVDDFPDVGRASPDRDRFVAFTKMTWLAMLRRAAPDCTHATAALDLLQAKFPDIEIDNESDPRVWGQVIEWEGVESPWGIEELLSRPAGEWLPQLIEFDCNDPLVPHFVRVASMR